MFKALIRITLKPGVKDAQGATICRALHAMEYGEVEEVRVGKYVEMALNARDREQAEKEVEEICHRLLANPVIEDYEFEVVGP